MYSTNVMRTIQPILWIIDISASMAGDRIELIEHMLVEYDKILKLKSKQSDDIECKTGILAFNTNFSWMNDGKLISEEEDITGSLHLSPEGVTNVGVVLDELNSKLSRHGLFKNGNYRTPVLVFVLDGHSTDNYRDALERLKENKWFRQSIKIGLAIGPESDVGLLKDITGEEGTFEDPSLVLNIFERLPLYDKGMVYSDDNNTELIKEEIDEDSSLTPFAHSNDTEMIIEINHVEHELHNGEYKIVRCQLGACDLRDADQACFLVKVQGDNKTVELVNVDPILKTLYTIHFNLYKHESLELGVDLLDGIIISGNVQVTILRTSNCKIIGMSDQTGISVSLRAGKQLLLELGKKYEVETITSKVSFTVNDRSDSWGDDWD